MLGIVADDADDSFAVYDFTLVTNLLDRSSNLHCPFLYFRWVLKNQTDSRTSLVVSEVKSWSKFPDREVRSPQYAQNVQRGDHHA